MMLKELQDKVAQMVQGQISISAFKDWFMPYSVNAHQEQNREVRQGIGKIMGRLAEYSQQHLSEEELRQQLAPIAGIIIVNLHHAPIIVANIHDNFAVHSVAWAIQPNLQNTENSRDADLVTT